MNDQQQATGLIPQSNALSEADPQSLTEIMSMNPEDLSEQQLRAIVAALRAQRERFAQAEAAKPQRAKATGGKASAEAILKTTAASADDLGF